MIDIHTNAEVFCSDGAAGLVTYIVSNPVNRRVTHLVIQSDLPPHYEYLVPVELVHSTTPHLIMMKCRLKEFRQMILFQYEEYLPTDVPSHLSWPYCVPVPGIVLETVEYIPVEHQNIPPGECVVRRGAKVAATDGIIGQVDELLINPSNMQVTHLVLLEKHFMQKKEVTIPVSLINHIDKTTICLKVDRQCVEGLPTTPIQRWHL